MSDGVHNMGSIRWELLGFLALAWVIVYFCLWKGVATTGKVVYVTATLPIILLFTFLIRGLTLPGAFDGLEFFFLPKWHKVCEPKVWINAASQVLKLDILQNFATREQHYDGRPVIDNYTRSRSRTKKLHYHIVNPSFV